MSFNRYIYDAEIAMREATMKWLRACGWSLHDSRPTPERSDEYWLHPDLGKADDMWTAVGRQLNQ